MAIKIINKPTTSIQQMKDWARKKGAYEFEKLAEPCYKASLKTGVDPAVSYCLSALETGWCYKNGTSQAGIDASYHNPAGLKIMQGGSDYDKNAHKRFRDWEEGYLAQQHHLALYAGADGYPLTITPDPRHFVYLLGRAKTVEDLGGKGKWNSNPNYGHNIVKLINELYSIPKTETRPEIKVEKEEKMENLVIYNGDADVFGAIILSQKLRCPLIKKSDYNENIKANKLHYVGGSKGDRYDTFKEVAKLL